MAGVLGTAWFDGALVSMPGFFSIKRDGGGFYRPQVRSDRAVCERCWLDDGQIVAIGHSSIRHTCTHGSAS